MLYFIRGIRHHTNDTPWSLDWLQRATIGVNMGLKNKKRNRPPETVESFRRRVEKHAGRDIRSIADCDDAAVDVLRDVGRGSIEIEFICKSRHGSLHAKVHRSPALSSDPEDLDGYSEELFMVNRGPELPATAVGRYTFVDGQLTFVPTTPNIPQ